jgi:hypothetical protein
VRERVLEESSVFEPVADPLLQIVEFVTEANDASPHVLAMALDDPARLVRVSPGNGDSNLAKRAHRHWPERLRIPGHAKADDSTAVEERRDDAGFDVGASRENDYGFHAARLTA